MIPGEEYDEIIDALSQRERNKLFQGRLEERQRELRKWSKTRAFFGALGRLIVLIGKGFVYIGRGLIWTGEWISKKSQQKTLDSQG